MLEQEIKASLINHLMKKTDSFSQDVIINEFFFDNFNRRADLLIIRKGRLIAYEIKSEFDDLNRLSGQVDNYMKYFDKVVIVVASKHVKNVIEKTPSSVEVLEVKGEKEFKQIRRGHILKNINSTNLLNLLKIRELRLLLKESYNIKTEESRESLINKLSKLSKVRLKKFIIECITTRYKYTSESFKIICQNKDVIAEDLKYLSNNKNIITSNNIITSFIKNKDDKNMMDMQKRSTYPIFGEIPEQIKKLLNEK